ncbi:AAA family ATPase [Bradyrhizobium sp. BRP14]|nr:AAA family ATPase [Bradyrhizobium sp. BRP14]
MKQHDAVKKALENEQEGSPWRCAADIEPRSVKWLWYPYIAAENINIIAGMGNVGKGLVSTHIAACITNGRRWPTVTESAPCGSVLWCEMEDGEADTLVPRMIAAGVLLQRVTIMNADEFRMAKEPQTLKAEILQRDIKLIVFSPLNSFLGGIDINNEIQVRKVLNGLLEAVKDTGCAILGIAHANKKGDLSAIERILGSVAFANFCRSVLLVAPDESGDEDEDQKRLVHAKHNLSQKGPDLIYTPVTAPGRDTRDQYVGLEWQRAERDVDATALLDRKPARGASRPSAGAWLIEYLTKNGKTLVTDIQIAAVAAGYKWEAVRKAHQRDPRFQSEQDGFQGPRSWWME